MKRSTKKILTFVLASMLFGAGVGTVAAYTDLRANELTTAVAATPQKIDDYTSMSVQGQATLSTYTNVKIDFGKKINDGPKVLKFDNYCELGDKLMIWYDNAWQSFNTLMSNPETAGKISAVLYDSYIDLQVDRRFIPALDLAVQINPFEAIYNSNTYALTATKAYAVTVKNVVAVEGSEHLTMVAMEDVNGYEAERELTITAWQKKDVIVKDSVEYTPFELKLGQNLSAGYETTELRNQLLYINDYILIHQKSGSDPKTQTLTEIRLSDLDQSVYGEISVRQDGSYLVVYVSNDWADYQAGGVYQNGMKKDGLWEFDITLREGFTYVDSLGNVYKTTGNPRVEIHQDIPYLYEGKVNLDHSFVEVTPQSGYAYAYQLRLDTRLSGTEVQNTIDGIYLKLTEYETDGTLVDWVEDGRISWDLKINGSKVIDKKISGNTVTIQLKDYFRTFDVDLCVDAGARVYFDTVGIEPDANYSDTHCWEVEPYAEPLQLKAAEYEINYYDDTAVNNPSKIVTLPFDSNTCDFAEDTITERFDATGKKRPTKVGYEFVKWVLADGSDVPDTSYYGDLQIYPQWSEIVYKAVVKVEYEGDEDVEFPDKEFAVTFDNIDDDDTHPALDDALNTLFAQIQNQGDENHENKQSLTAWNLSGKTSLAEDPWFIYDTYNDISVNPAKKEPIGLYKAAFSDVTLRTFDGWDFDETEQVFVRTFTIKATKQAYTITLDYNGKLGNRRNETLTLKWGEPLEGAYAAGEAQNPQGLPAPENIARTDLAAYLESANGYWVDASWLATLTDDAWDSANADQLTWKNPNMATVCEEYVWGRDTKFYVGKTPYAVGDITLRAMWTPKVYTVVHQFDLDGATEEAIAATRGSFQFAIDKWFGIVTTLEDVVIAVAPERVVEKGALTILNEELAKYVPARNDVDDIDGQKWHDKFIYNDYVVAELGLAQLDEANENDNTLTYTVTTTRKQYSVTYHNFGRQLNGEEFASKSYDWGTEIDIASGSSLVREGYTFIGWRDSNAAEDAPLLNGPNPDDPESVGDTLIVPVNKNTTLEAIWELNVYELTLKNIRLDGERYVYDDTAEPIVVKFSILDSVNHKPGVEFANNYTRYPAGIALQDLILRNQVEETLYLTYLPDPNPTDTYIWTKDSELYWQDDTYYQLMPDLNFTLENATYTVDKVDSVSHTITKYIFAVEESQKAASTWAYTDIGILSATNYMAFGGWDITYYYGANVKINFQLDYEDGNWRDARNNLMSGAYIYMPAADVKAESIWYLYSNVLKVVYDCDCDACEALGGNSHQNVLYHYGADNGIGLSNENVHDRVGLQGVVVREHPIAALSDPQKYEYYWGATSWGGTLGELPFADSANPNDFGREYTVTFVVRERRHRLNFYWYDGFVEYKENVYESEIALPTPIQREGYTFNGWKDANGNPVSDTVIMPLGGATVYAQWIVNDYTFCILDDQGNVLYNELKTIIDYNNQVAMEQLLGSYLPEDTAEYWYAWDVAIPQAFTAHDYTFKIVKTANNYTLKVGTAAEQTIPFGTPIGNYLNPPTLLPGKTFGGWETADGTRFDKNSTMPAYNCVLTAVWTLDIYKVTVVHPNGRTDTIHFAIEENLAEGIYKQVDALVALRALLPAEDATATYSWGENLPTALLLRDYTFTVVAHEKEVEPPQDDSSIDSSSSSTQQGGFTSIVASCKGCNGCGSVASGLLGGVTVLGAALVALLRKKED